MHTPIVTIEQLLTLAETFRRSGNSQAARSIYLQILSSHPDHAETLNCLGLLSDNPAESIECFRRALLSKPVFPEAAYNLGTMLVEHGSLDEAVRRLSDAIQMRPDYIPAYQNRGAAFTRCGKFEDALIDYRYALDLSPASPSVRWDCASTLFLLNRWEEGWRLFEKHWGGMILPRPELRTPRWNGEVLEAGRSILIYAEQGLGDTLHFLRYLPFAKTRLQAGRVIFECQQELVRLLAGPVSELGIEMVARAPTPPVTDQHISLLGLPLAIKMYEPFAPGISYVPAYVTGETWVSSSDRTSNPIRVGITWAGSSVHEGNRHRSISPENLQPVLRTQGVTFYSLQVGQPAPAGMIDLTTGIRDFADTAALIASLDLVITVDTAVAHLAGAMGRPVWTLLPFVPDWRWGLEREDTPWYPTMKLFRQKTAGDWAEVIARVAGELGRISVPPGR